MGSDALAVDIPVLNAGGRTEPQKSFRLCTTHLDSLWSWKPYRCGQLAIASELLKGSLFTKSEIIAGLVGGDMIAIDRFEDELHRASDVDLRDVWEDLPAPPVPVLKPFQRDLSYGRARGNIWGYQSNTKNRKRMDKFFYTGSTETIVINEAQDVSGRLGRLGIDLKKDVEASEYKTTKISVVWGKFVRKPCKEYYSEDLAARLRDSDILGKTELVRTRINTWVSDHFGIAVSIKVL